MLSLSQVATDKYFTHLNGYKIRDAEAYIKHGFINVRKLGAKGDGKTDDYPIIQDALNKYKFIYIPEGVYNLSDTIITPDTCYIYCDRNARLVCKHKFKMIINATPNYVVSGYNANSNITIDGGIWDLNYTEFDNTRCNFVFGHAHDITIKNVQFLNSIATHTIELAGCKNVLIDNCFFNGFIQYENDYAEAIQVEPCGFNGFSYFGESDLTICENVTVRNCIFDKNHDDENTTFFNAALGQHGVIHNIFMKNILFENNVVRGCTFAGVRPCSFDGVIVKNNHFENCARAVMIDGGENAAILNGNTTTSSGIAQTTKNVIVTDNFFKGCSPCIWGITRNNPNTVTAFATNVSITNNIMSDSDTAIYLAFFRDLTIENNIIDGATKTALHIMNLENVVLMGNTFANVPNAACLNISEYTQTVPLDSYNIVINNNMFKNVYGHAISFRRVYGVTVSGNVFTDCSAMYTDTDIASTINVNNFVESATFCNNVMRWSTSKTNPFLRITGVHNKAFIVANNSVYNMADIIFNAVGQEIIDAHIKQFNNVIF